MDLGTRQYHVRIKKHDVLTPCVSVSKTGRGLRLARGVPFILTLGVQLNERCDPKRWSWFQHLEPDQSTHVANHHPSVGEAFGLANSHRSHVLSESMRAGSQTLHGIGIL